VVQTRKPTDWWILPSHCFDRKPFSHTVENVESVISNSSISFIVHYNNLVNSGCPRISTNSTIIHRIAAEIMRPILENYIAVTENNDVIGIRTSSRLTKDCFVLLFRIQRKPPCGDVVWILEFAEETPLTWVGLVVIVFEQVSHGPVTRFELEWSEAVEYVPFRVQNNRQNVRVSVAPVVNVLCSFVRA
jgi:hypothetical protein